MAELVEDKKYIKFMIIGFMLLLMLFMLFSFPSSSATTDNNDSKIVSIR